MKKLFMLGVGIVSAIYLLNPTAGIFEVLPDNLPGVGNIDEVLATILLVNSLAFFGIDLSRFSRPRQPGPSDHYRE